MRKAIYITFATLFALCTTSCKKDFELQTEKPWVAYVLVNCTNHNIIVPGWAGDDIFKQDAGLKTSYDFPAYYEIHPGEEVHRANFFHQSFDQTDSATIHFADGVLLNYYCDRTDGNNVLIPAEHNFLNPHEWVYDRT